MNEESLGSCPICGRDMDKKNSNLHHLVPKLKGGKKGDTVRLHVICHSKIHSLWTEAVIRDDYNTIAKIMLGEDMKKFAKWISKKPANFSDSNKQSKNKKNRKH